MTRKIRRLRQLVPTKFATISRPVGGKPEFVRWWMWLGRSYRVVRTAV